MSVVFAVGDPVRTVDSLLRAEGATRTAVGTDEQRTRVERISVRIAALGWLLSATALTTTVLRSTHTGARSPWAATAGGVGAVVFAATVATWIDRTRQTRHGQDPTSTSATW